MLDYKLIEALGAVILEGGFERAARQLNITQSAVSQRIKLLEELAGTVLLVRASPPQLTAAGRQVMKHFQQVESLEQGLHASLMLEQDSAPRLTIGINDDSLATWFLQAVQDFLKQNRLLLDLRVDDQEQTIGYLKTAEVMACLSSHDKPVQGCTMDRLGVMNYRLVSGCEFYDRWFADGINEHSLALAPAVIFNRKDLLHQKALERFFSTVPEKIPCHYIPSSEQFVEFICQGFAYGVVPDIQASSRLAEGELMELVPGAVYPVQLYWHCWGQRSAIVEDFTGKLLRAAALVLR